MPLWTILTKCPAPLARSVQVAVLRCRDLPVTAGRPPGGLDAGSQYREDRFDLRDGVGLAADHQAVPAFRAPHPAARATVQQPDVAFRQPFRVPDIVAVVGVSAVDDGVAGI